MVISLIDCYANTRYIESEQAVAIKTLVRCRQGSRSMRASEVGLVKSLKVARLTNTAVVRRRRIGAFTINDVRCRLTAVV